jgi:hypothetical protein
MKLSVLLMILMACCAQANRGSGGLVFADHDYVNPFTGGVAWETSQNSDVLSMEWAFIGLSEVLPSCAGPFDWSSVDDFLNTVDARGHQAILRPVVFGPGYGTGNFAPADMLTNDFLYEGTIYQNPDWADMSVQSCVLTFIDAFALRYKDDQRIAYIQMGLAGLWGEHHLDGGPYTASSFPSFTFQKTMISHYVTGFGTTGDSLLTALSLDATQAHGFFGSGDQTLDGERFSFFDDSLLITNHNDVNNWRQDPIPAAQLAVHKHHGWGGEAYWSGCNSNGSWAIPPYDCGNGETLHDQALRIGLNYMLGSPAFTGGQLNAAQLLAANQQMGYKFTATAASRTDVDQVSVTVENTGVAHSPYPVAVCTSEGCAGDLSTLAPGTQVMIEVPATADATQVLFFSSPRLNPASALKIRWSNAGANGLNATLSVVVNPADVIFADGFDGD